MEEFDISEFLKFFLSKIKYIIVAVFIFLVLGFFYVKFIVTPMYHSSITLILTSNTNQNAASLQSDINLNKNLVTTYSEIVKSRSVLQQVIDNLYLNETVGELSQGINVSSVENTEIIKIEVSADDNKKAQLIATSIAEVFTKEIQKIYNLTNISVIDKASLETAPYNINYKKQLLVAGGLGFVLSITVILLAFYFDTSIKSSKDIEEKLNLPVIGTVVFIDKKGE